MYIEIEKKRTWIAYILWFFLGFWGVHKFYLGRIGWGILYFFTGGLFFVGWLIDMMTIPSQVRRANQLQLSRVFSQLQ